MIFFESDYAQYPFQPRHMQAICQKDGTWTSFRSLWNGHIDG